MPADLRCPQLDLRELPPTDHAQAVLGLFQHLPVGEAVILCNDSSLQALHQRLQAQWPGQFSWTELPAPAGSFEVRVGRLPAGRSCCGHCGG